MKITFKNVLLIIIGLIVLMIIIGSNDSKTPPNINWSKYAPYKKTGIEKSINERSCSGLQRALDASSESEIISFIDWHMRNIGCYK